MREEMKRRRRKRREGKNWQPCKGLRKAGMGSEKKRRWVRMKSSGRTGTKRETGRKRGAGGMGWVGGWGGWEMSGEAGRLRKR